MQPLPGMDAVIYRYALYGPLDDADLFEFFEVLTDGGLRQAQEIHEIRVAARVGFQEILNDRDPRGMSEYPGIGSQFILRVSKKVGFCKAHGAAF